MADGGWMPPRPTKRIETNGFPPGALNRHGTGADRWDGPKREMRDHAVMLYSIYSEVKEFELFTEYIHVHGRSPSTQFSVQARTWHPPGAERPGLESGAMSEERAGRSRRACGAGAAPIP